MSVYCVYSSPFFLLCCAALVAKKRHNIIMLKKIAVWGLPFLFCVALCRRRKQLIITIRFSACVVENKQTFRGVASVTDNRTGSKCPLAGST